MELTPLSHHEVHLWALQMHLLLTSGMPLHHGLELLAAGEELPRIASVCDLLAEGISQGHSLSQAMKAIDPTFSDLVVNFVAIGEKTGRLHQVFERVSERALQRGQTEQVVRAALAYPIFLTVVSVAMAAFMAFYMFPQILPFLTGLGVPLPWPTRALLWVTQHLGWVFLSLTVLAGWMGYLMSSQAEWLYYQSPLLGRLNRNRVYADSLADLSMLLESQGDLLVSLDSLRPPWQAQRRRVLACVKAIETGSSVSQAVAETGLFPNWLLAPIASAEETGQFATTFQYLAGQLEEAVLMEVERLLQMLEPLLMAAMGLIVGFVILATFLPLYSLTTQI
ncbi:MAG: type II secretion system F family protein [Candidatus Eremiobacteraeota bacterium]|nr:type II secretion system F family protein [Candidatus Eremiobacteraeota bacterium]